MKGIFLKEFYTLNVYRKTFLLMIAIVVGMSIFTGIGNTYIPMMLMMFLMITSLNLFAVDENSNWDRYAITMPLTRFQFVVTRYLFLLACLVFMFGFTTLLSWGVNLVKPTSTAWLSETLALNGIMSLCFLFVTSISAPLCYKFGAEKSRIWIMFVFLIPFAGAVFAMPYVLPFLQGLSQLQTILLGAGSVVFLLLLYLLSAHISTRIYAKKEF